MILQRFWYSVRRIVQTGNKTHMLLAALVFLATSAAYLYYWTSVKQSLQQDLQTAYAREVRAASLNGETRMHLYETILNGAAGLARTDPHLTPEKWNSFFKPYNIEDTLPAIQGVGFGEHVPAAAVPGFMQKMQSLGRDDFRIFPAGERERHVVVTFNAPFKGNNGASIGYDGLADPVRREAIERAVESGHTVMSGGIELVNATESKRPAFILCRPIFREGMPMDTLAQRWEAAYGFVYLAVDMNSMLSDVMGETDERNFALQVFDAEVSGTARQRPLYESANFKEISQDEGALTNSRITKRFEHQWQSVYAASPSLLSERERQMPTDVLVRGLFASIFFAALVWYLLTHRERKLTHIKHQEVQHAKDELLSLASHQLRTPATVVKQYVGMLLQGYGGKLTGQQMQMLTNAYDSNERQLEIINQLLYVARLDAGRIQLRRQNTDVTKLLAGVIADQSTAAHDRKQTIISKLGRGPLKADIDPHYIRMVFENLLSNAIKYTPDGGTITVRLRKSGDELYITFADNGVGIPQSNHQTIFDKFTRVENELSTDVNGSGVGLYLTREIVNLHNGIITVESSIGDGSVFTVRLPRRAERAEVVGHERAAQDITR